MLWDRGMHRKGFLKETDRLLSYEESMERMVNRRALVRESSIHKKEGKMLK